MPAAARQGLGGGCRSPARSACRPGCVAARRRLRCPCRRPWPAPAPGRRRRGSRRPAPAAAAPRARPALADRAPRERLGVGGAAEFHQDEGAILVAERAEQAVRRRSRRWSPAPRQVAALGRIPRRQQRRQEGQIGLVALDRRAGQRQVGAAAPEFVGDQQQPRVDGQLGGGKLAREAQRELHCPRPAPRPAPCG